MQLPRFSSISEGLRSTALRFPVPTVFAFLTTAILFFAIGDDFDRDSPGRFVLLAGLGFVASLLVDLSCEVRPSKTGQRLTAQAILLALLAGYGALGLPEELRDTRPPFWYGYLILLFILHLAIALVPAVGRGSAQALWRFNLSCFLRFFFSSVNAALLFGGLALALLSVDKLFELNLDGEIYPQVWVVCAFLAHPLLFLGGLPRLGDLQVEQPFPKALRFTLCFIGLPLVVLYLFILYAYVAKIGLQWDWPNGWVAMPIFVLAVISLLTYVLGLPLAKTEPWARLYHRWLLRLLLPLALVLFLALQVRLGDYGMTINRYLGLALAVWLFALSLAYLLRPNLRIGWMPFSLLTVSFFSIAAGPFGAFGWSERSQVQRLNAMAAQMGILSAGQFVPTDKAQSPEEVEAFQSSLRYLMDNFGTTALETELADYFRTSWRNHEDARSGYGATRKILAYLKLDDDLENTRLYFYANLRVLPTQSHAWLIDFNLYSQRNRDNIEQYTIDDRKLEFNAPAGEERLVLKVDGSVLLEIDLAPWAESVKTQIARQENSRSGEPLIWHAEAGGWRFSFVCTNAQLEADGRSFQSAHFKTFLTPPSRSESRASEPAAE